MRNPLFVALLIVNLLTCPLRCLACEMHATSSAVSSCATCECCKHWEEAPVSNPAPSTERDECGCKSCICDGAVVESPAELPDPGPALIWMLPLYLESNRHLGVTEIADPADAKHAGQILSGRGARIAYQSWQIWAVSNVGDHYTHRPVELLNRFERTATVRQIPSQRSL